MLAERGKADTPDYALLPLAVPTPRLPELATRIDKVMPRIKRKQVF
ncbi:MAG: hypothetical protein AB7H80_07415 [Candidatus Kapaibacterium sp.]